MAGGNGRRGRGACSCHARSSLLALLAAMCALLASCAAGRVITPRAKPRVPSLPVLEPGTGCVASDYAGLLNATLDMPACGGDNEYLYLACGNATAFSRGALGPLEMKHDAFETLTHEPAITVSSAGPECVTTITIDLTQNDALPALTVRGDIGIHKFSMRNVRFVVIGADPAAGDIVSVCTTRPCSATPIIDIRFVEHVELINVTVAARTVSTSNAPLPYTGIAIKGSTQDEPQITLTDVAVNRLVDGVSIVGGGPLTATGLRATRNSNAGLYYSCDMITRSSVALLGSSSLSSNRYGLFVDCEGDFIELNVTVQGNVSLTGNSQHGAWLLGHAHGRFGPGVTVANNGWVANAASGPPTTKTQCGGGVHAHFQYGTPLLSFAGTTFSNNTAQYGGGLGIEVPETAQPLYEGARISGPLYLLDGTVFTGNVATVCGGAMATVADVLKSRLFVNVTEGAHVLPDNGGKPGWCIGNKFDGNFMEVELH